ncbi:MAG: GNAT family N-acetyltransferase [Muribaculaceae bacterium]|nr:GNAT family N-acetyltransferase [Muribaculaceae bacterium]
MKSVWDNLVDRSKNATFLLKRDYMDYHADRFQDFSLVIADDDGTPMGLLPATLHQGHIIKSHGGLTYGGLIMTDRTSASDPLLWFEAITNHYRQNGITDLYYKPIPHIYHRHPSEEDLYALFRFNATLNVRNLATVIDLRHPIKSSRLTKRAEKRQRQGAIWVKATDNVNDFWQIIIDDRRTRHNTVPVHTAEELTRLHAAFPQNIRFFISGHDNDIMAGAVIYYSNGVLHLQYAAATDVGKEAYATDIIYNQIIYNVFPEAEYFDFGTSNEEAGRYLNIGMTRHKEEFGGRSIVYDTYHLPL